MNIISIITPSFNQEKYIEDTIKSVFNQSGNFYIDYIIQDGGSKDKSVNIIKKYENYLINSFKTKKIKGITFYFDQSRKIIKNNGISFRWESKHDGGQVQGISIGFKKSVGNILCWLNSDDILHGHNSLEKVTQIFSNNSKIKIVFGDGHIIDEKGKRTGTWKVNKINYLENLYLDYHILQPSSFIKKSIYTSNLLQEKYICALDAYYFITLINRGHQFYKTNEILSEYRMYPEIKTISLKKKRYWEQFEIARRYSNNIFYLLISFVYRYFEIILKPKISNKLFQSFFSQFRKFSYLIITGKTDRNYE